MHNYLYGFRCYVLLRHGAEKPTKIVLIFFDKDIYNNRHRA
jgi:hypothetical protein